MALADHFCLLCLAHDASCICICDHTTSVLLGPSGGHGVRIECLAPTDINISPRFSSHVRPSYQTVHLIQCFKSIPSPFYVSTPFTWTYWMRTIFSIKLCSLRKLPSHGELPCQIIPTGWCPLFSSNSSRIWQICRISLLASGNKPYSQRVGILMNVFDQNPGLWIE